MFSHDVNNTSQTLSIFPSNQSFVKLSISYNPNTYKISIHSISAVTSVSKNAQCFKCSISLVDNLVVAIYSYEPNHDGDLGFEKGNKLKIINK